MKVLWILVFYVSYICLSEAKPMQMVASELNTVPNSSSDVKSLSNEGMEYDQIFVQRKSEDSEESEEYDEKPRPLRFG